MPFEMPQLSLGGLVIITAAILVCGVAVFSFAVWRGMVKYKYKLPIQVCRSETLLELPRYHASPPSSFPKYSHPPAEDPPAYAESHQHSASQNLTMKIDRFYP